MTMFIIEALQPEGWVEQDQHPVEYWAIQQAQSRCCVEGITYRIRDTVSGQVTAVVETSSCRALMNRGN